MGQNLLGPLVVGHDQGPFQAWDFVLIVVLLLGVGLWDQNLLLQGLEERHFLGVVVPAGEQAYGALACLVLGDLDVGLSLGVDLQVSLFHQAVV